MKRTIEDLVAPGIGAIRPYEPGKPIEEVERELGPSVPAGGVIKLASNENPLGPSPRAMAAIRATLPEIHRYPDGGGYYLRRALAAHHAKHGVREEELAVGNGSNEILDLLVRTFCGPGDEVIAPAQTFVCYKLSAQARGVGYRDVPRGKDFAYDLDGLADAAGPHTKVVFLANPDNPTGVYAGTEAVRRLMRRLPEHVILAVDEAYYEYATAGDHPDMLALRGERELTVTMRTFSKIYGLAGLRCGWAVGPAQLVEYLNRVRNPFNVSALAQAAAVAALGDEEHVRRSQLANREGMAYLTGELDRLRVRFTPSHTNFLLVDVAPHDGREVFMGLLARGVIVRPMGGYGLPHQLRITIGTPEELRRLSGALTAVLGLGGV
jgi:histidinol-phosphate aminotransferase